MVRRLKRKLLLGVAVVAVAAGVTAAVVMAAQPSAKAHRHGNRHSASLASSAEYLGLTTAQLRSDLQSGKSLAEIANATPGKSANGLIQALEAADKQKLAAASANVARRVTAEVDRAGGPLAGHNRAGRRDRRRTHLLTVAAAYLGISTTQLRHDRRSGDTLAQIAKQTSGKSEAGLVEALVAAVKTQLAARVTAGKITQAKANELLPRLTARVTAVVNRAPHQHAPGQTRHTQHTSAY